MRQKATSQAIINPIEDEKQKNVYICHYNINSQFEIFSHQYYLFQQKRKIVEILKKPPLSRSPTQLAYLQKATENIKFFKDILEKEEDDEIHQQCCQYMTYESHPKGHPVIIINDIGDKFYIILSGSVSVHIKKEQDDMSENPELKKVAVMPTGVSFGELALISNKPRMATIICEEDCEFLILSKKPFDKILKKKSLNSKLAYLETLAFCQEINKGYLRDIYSRSDYQSFVNKQSVFLEGAEATAMYVVTKGSFKAMKRFYVKQDNEFSTKGEQDAEVFKIQEKKQEFKVMQILTFNQNEYFGEEELVDGNKRAYTVVCESVSGELLKIKKNLFLAKVMGDHGGKKYMGEHIQRKKNHLKLKYSQVQQQVDKFWKFLREDRQQLKNDMEFQKESFKRQKQVDQYNGSSSLSNFDDLNNNLGRNNQRKQASLAQFDNTFMNNLSSGGQDDNLKYNKNKNRQSVLSVGQSLISFNKRSSLAQMDNVSQNKLAENIQKIISSMADAKDSGDQNLSSSKSKEFKSFFQNEVTITNFIESASQNKPNSNQNGVNSIQEEKNMLMQQLREQQSKEQYHQQIQHVVSLNQVQALSLQQQQDLLYQLFQNHPSQKEALKQSFLKKFVQQNNEDNLHQTISSQLDQKINLMGLDSRDIPVSKYELFKDIIKQEDKKIDFRVYDDQKEDYMNKKQIQKQPYKDYLKDQKDKTQNKIIDKLKKKATKHLRVDANSTKEEPTMYIEQAKINEKNNAENTQTISTNNNETTQVMRLPLTHQQSLGLDQTQVKSSQESTPYESQKRNLTLNTLQIDSFRTNSLQISPIPNVISNFNFGNTGKKNLFDTINEISQNETKQKTGTHSDHKSHTKNNKSFGETTHPINVRSQAFMTFSQRSKESAEGRSQSYHNLITQSSGKKQRLQSAQATLFSPIKEEQGVLTQNINNSQSDNKNNKTLASRSQYSLKQQMITSPSLMYIQHESQSPDLKKNRGQISKFSTTQSDIGQLQRQEYYIGKIGSQISQNIESSDNQSAEKTIKAKNHHQKGLSLQLKSSNSQRVLKQNQSQAQSNHNLDCEKTSPLQKVVNQNQNTIGCQSSPKVIQKKPISLRLLSGNNIMLKNNQRQQQNNSEINATNNNTFTKKCSYININALTESVANIDRNQSNTNDYGTVQEEDREEHTPQSKKVKMNSSSGFPNTNKFKFAQEINTISQRTGPGKGYFSAQLSLKQGGESFINNTETRKLIQESLLQTPCLSAKSISGQKIAMRPYSAINKTKECNNSFFNTLNANNFVKSSIIKKRRLISPNVYQIMNSSNLVKNNSLINKIIEKRPSFQGDQSKFDILQYYHQSHNTDNFNAHANSQILSSQTTKSSTNKQITLKQSNSVAKIGSNQIIPQILESNTSTINTEFFGMQAPRGDNYVKSSSTTQSKVFDGQGDTKETSKSPAKQNSKNKILSKEFNFNIEVHQ